MATHSVRGEGGRFVSGSANRPSTVGSQGGTFTDSLTPGIERYAEHMLGAVHHVMREWAKEALQYMRQNAPWNDRTGQARASLGYAIDEGLDEATITLYHGVSYGIWLEIALNGEYAIIMPTIEALGPDLMRRLEVML